MTTAFQQLASKASEKYRETILSIAQGNEHDPESVMQIARDAGRSAIQLAADVETATDRYERHQEFHGRDFDAEYATANQDYLAAAKVQADAGEALTKAREFAKTADEQARVALSRRDRIKQEQADARNSFSRSMKATAGEGQDYTDWKSFQLAD